MSFAGECPVWRTRVLRVRSERNVYRPLYKTPVVQSLNAMVRPTENLSIQRLMGALAQLLSVTKPGSLKLGGQDLVGLVLLEGGDAGIRGGHYGN